MGGFVEHAEQERQTNQQLPGSSQGQAQSELLLSVPDVQIHQVIEREERAIPLAEGTLTVVSVSLPGPENRIGLVAKVGEFEYPLAKDTACLRSSPHQYVFVLSDGVLIGLTLPGDTPPEAVDLFELLLEQCCDFAIQQDGSAHKPGEVLITKPGNGERQEVAVDSAGRPQQRENFAAGQPGFGANPSANQGKNKYVVSGPDTPSPSQYPPSTSGPAAYDTGLPGSQPTGVNKYVVSGPGMPAAPPGLGQGTAPGTSSYGGSAAYERTGAYVGAGHESQVPVVHPDGSVTGAQPRPKKVGERLAAIVGSGAAMLGQGIVKGGEWTANKIQEHGQKQKAKTAPNERPAVISPTIQSGLRGANQASKTADATAKKVVGGAVYVITAVASSVGAAVHAVGGSSQPGKEPKVGARALAVASVDGIAHVFDALETSGKRVMGTSREVGSDLMQHKYGAQAGQLTSDGMSSLGHMIHAGWTIRKLGFRTVARSAATNTALHVIRNSNDGGNGSETQGISGWNTAPAQGELDEARRANQASVAVGMI